MIRFECPHCGNPMKVPEKAAGRKGNCKNCNKPVMVPGSVSIKVSEPEVIRRPPPVPSPYPETPRHFTTNQPSVSVQVNNQASHSNSMGIGSVILGIIALFVCWIPIVNFISLLLGGIGEILAVIGLHLGMKRDGKGIGYSLAGGVICMIAFGVALFVILAVGAVTSSAVVAVDSTVKQINKAYEKRKDQQDKEQLAIKEKWSKAGDKATAGDGMVNITYGNLGPIKTSSFGSEPAESDEEYLSLGLKIKNSSDTKKHDYLSWGWSFNIDQPILKDEFGNKYKLIGSTNSVSIVGQTTSDELYPGDSIEDVLVFEKPVDRARKLELELPGNDLTNNEPLYFRFYAP